MADDEDTSQYMEEVEQNDIWIPQVNEDLKPKVGMLFESVDEGINFYTKYAKEGGFGFRKSSTGYVPNRKDLHYKKIVCAKQGNPTLKNIPLEAVIRRKSIVREGCEAAIRLTRNKEDKWAITKFAEGHNHPLASPHKVHLFPSHRQVTPTKKRLFKEAKAANISTSKAVALFGIQAGGYENIGCTERDIRNLDWKEKQEEKEYDAQNMIDHFTTEKEGNPSFFYAYEKDFENKLTHCFWADGRARKAYHYFGDVVVFDTTYDTNQYSMIFAPFTGINHHGQSTIFGAGFLKDEKTESFKWIFQKFLEAMSSKEPNVIITDQDPAMGAAISSILPRSRHKFCMWHIMNKVTEKLGAIAYNANFMQPFKHCIWSTETSDEFETEWTKVITENKLEGNNWLASLYDIRSKWIPAYSKDIFTAGCRTTQRSESMNSFFSNYVRKKNTLIEFYTNFQMAVKRLRHRELQADHSSINSNPQMKTCFSMEKQMGKIYTRDMFHAFQTQLVESMYYGANPVMLDERSITYVVKKEGSRSREVLYIKENNEAMCSCKMFETEGVPCRHILLVLRSHFVTSLPDNYILNRWKITALSDSVFDVDGIELDGDYNAISQASTADWSFILSKCINKAKVSPEIGNFFLEALANAYEGMEKMTLIMDGETSQSVAPKSIPSQLSVRPPDISKTKGSGKRIKGGKEISMEQGKLKDRQCRGCGKRGVDHDKRNCPLLKQGNKFFDSQASVTDVYRGEFPIEEYTNLDSDKA